MMYNYLKNKYAPVNEFALRHVEYELLCSENEAKILTKTILKQKKLPKYFAMTLNEFVTVVKFGLHTV